MTNRSTILLGDARLRLRELSDKSVQTCITSPPYWSLRDYGHEDQIGQESSPQEFVRQLVGLFKEIHRVLKDEGTVWLNLGDTYAAHAGGNPNVAETLAGGKAGLGDKFAKRGRPSGYTPHRDAAAHGLKHKDLIGIPWRVAFALQEAGWYLRQDIVWHKPNPMPESVTDRCTKAHEYVFLLTKSERYYFDAEAIAEPSLHYGTDSRSDKGNIRYQGKRTQGDASKNGQQGFVTINEKKNKRSVWTINTRGFNGAHFAVMPEELVVPCVLAGSRPEDFVLDPFTGSGTTGSVALRLGRRFIGCELNPEYAEIARQRLDAAAVDLFNTSKTIVIP